MKTYTRNGVFMLLVTFISCGATYGLEGTVQIKDGREMYSLDLRDVWLDADSLNQLTTQKKAIIDFRGLINSSPSLKKTIALDECKVLASAGANLASEVSQIINRFGLFKDDTMLGYPVGMITIRVITYAKVGTRSLYDVAKQAPNEKILPECIIQILPKMPDYSVD